jgi:hypothetical protein
MRFIPDMRPHGRNIVLQMLGEAKVAVANGEMHLRAQEARVWVRMRTAELAGNDINGVSV